LATPQTVSYSLSGNSTTLGTDLHISGADGANTRITQDAFGTGSYVAFTGRASRGTAAAPTQTVSGDTLTQFTARGFSNGTLQFGNASTGRVDIVAAENFTDTARGTNVQIYTTAAGAITPTAVATFSSANGFSAVGNVSGGNLLTGGLASVTGNITGGNVLTAGLISATSTITSAANITGGNLLTGGLISATSTITSAANITGGNLLTGGLVSATSNITGGNILTAGIMSSTGNATHGNLSVTGNITGNTNGFTVGYLNIPQVSLASNVSIALTDAGKHYYTTSASNLTLTIANNTSVAWAVGTAISVINRGTANVAIAQDTGVSLYLAGNATSGNRIVTTYGMATLINTAANVWMISGTVV